LAGGSTVKVCPKLYGDKTRAVYLDGEAFFDVVHQAIKAVYVVKSGHISYGSAGYLL
jgi:ferric-dicitrate binding protein FerR (iron transport regulator)